MTQEKQVFSGFGYTDINDNGSLIITIRSNIKIVDIKQFKKEAIIVLERMLDDFKGVKNANGKV